jgi:hypothetical protein
MSVYPSAALPAPIREAKIEQPVADDDDVPVTKVADEGEPTPQPSYPSIDGGQVAGAHAAPAADASAAAPAA